jgi:hypothetical protein
VGTIDCSEKKAAFTTWASRRFANDADISVYLIGRLAGPLKRSAPIGMIGLRVAPTTLRLTARQILRLAV